MAELLLRTDVSSATEMVMLLKAFVKGSLPPIPIVPQDEDNNPNEVPPAGTKETTQEETANNGAAPAERPAAQGPAATTHSVEEIEAHGGQVLLWLMNLKNVQSWIKCQ